MSNLLPPNAERAVENFHRARFVLVGSLAAIACGAVVLLALMPLYAIVRAERTAAEESVSNTAAASSSERDREDITRAQALIRELRPVASSTVSALEILDAALGARPKGVTVTNIHYSRGNPGTIVLQGLAPSREEISALRMVLAKDPHFSGVSVPIGILTGVQGGQFTVTLTGTF